MTTQFVKARFHIDSGPSSLFERVRLKMKGQRKLKTHAQHLRDRAAERGAPLGELEDFDSKVWQLVTAEVRSDSGKFVNSTWTREIQGETWWVVIGFNDTIETVFSSKKFGLGPDVVQGGALFDFVARVNRDLMLAE